ncbi:hypothetical protein [Ralstonia flatus]|uniref:Uncharacterized protein n=1 Tax=Ralstonia flatus TaxID=3058601 RepID=A0ABN9KGZ5_9RALS|nr:hypothetical protein [Ralstonia sp. LMG 32965]MBN6209432.1 hypothetical protein [Ralstonia pickettii]CAJ0893542.1 hypothetical protein R77564_03721 [Ralstonia sp. LMG 32965]
MTKSLPLMEDIWGLLGPDSVESSRRTRTLGLGASVRLFNDLAVPGIGGVWYAKQLLLATLGVSVAEQARKLGAKVQNVEVANAIEALACRLAFDSNKWNRDARLRGNSKLQGKGDDLRFSRVRQRNFYVTQPMRMAMVQALPALGLVKTDSTRFNAFRPSEAGMKFVEEGCKNYRPYNRSVMEHLSLWVQDQDDRVRSDVCRDCLSPLVSLEKDALRLLRERLLQGGHERPEDKERRRNALAWVENIRVSKRDPLTWGTKPKEITDAHWQDLLAGARFFNARAAAIQVLDVLEAHMGNQAHGQSYAVRTATPESLSSALDSLRAAAQAFLEMQHKDLEANSFCRECASGDDSQILQHLVTRDGHVLRLVGDEVKPGRAFRGSAPAEVNGDEAESPEGGGLLLPEGISYRVRNLYLLNLDLHGQLDPWLNPSAVGDHP